MSEDFNAESFISDHAVDPRNIVPVPPVKVQDGFRYSTIVTEPMHSRGVLQFELMTPTEGGSTESRWALARTRRERIGLEKSGQYMVEAIGYRQQVRVTRLQGSGFEVGLGCLFTELEIEVLDTVDIEFVVIDGYVEGVEIKVRPAADQALNRELFEILEFTEPDLEVSPYWFFAEEFLGALIMSTHPSQAGREIEDHMGGVEVRHEGAESAHAWVQWVWLSPEKLTLFVPEMADSTDGKAQARELELRMLGFRNRAGHAVPNQMDFEVQSAPRQASAVIIKVLRDAIGVQIEDVFSFHPASKAGNILIRSHRKSWMQHGPKYVDSAARELRAQVEAGFSLPGPLLMPKWLVPFFEG